MTVIGFVHNLLDQLISKLTAPAAQIAYVAISGFRVRNTALSVCRIVALRQGSLAGLYSGV